MPAVTLRPLLHRGLRAIAIEAPKDPTRDAAIRKLKELKWSQTHKVWYVPLSKANYQQIMTALNTVASIDTTPLRAFLQKRSRVMAVQAPAAPLSSPPSKPKPKHSPAIHPGKEDQP